MAGRIQTLKDKLGHLFPRTVAEAVIMKDGTTLDYAIENIPSDSIKLSPAALAALNLPEGYTLSDFLVLYATKDTSNTVVAAEVVE